MAQYSPRVQNTLLGLDIGTTATKAVLFDLSGTELLTAEQDYPLSTPQAGWAEQDPEKVWNAVVAVLKTVVEQAGPYRHILALALAAQCGSIIPLGADDVPIYPMITWLDNRAKTLVKQWQSDGIGEMVRQLSGWRLQPGLPLSTISWLRQFQPAMFARVRRFTGVHDYLNYRLTGHFCTDLSAGAEMQLVDVSTAQWSPQLCDLAGISPNQLPQLKPAGTIIGPITPTVSQLTGLSNETLVINGGHDHSCTALAMGIMSTGKVMLATGTAWVLTGVVETSSVDAIPDNMDLNFHVAPQRWTISQFLGGFGASVEWYLQQCWSSGDIEADPNRGKRYADFDNAIVQSQPGCNGLFFLPLGGQAQLSGSKPEGGFVGLRLDHTRIDMSRAVLEGAAYELRWALENIRQAGLPVDHLWVVGGATRSPVWPQILADVGRVPISLSQYTHWPALGAAILAGSGTGSFKTLEAGITRFQKAPLQILPDETQSQVFHEGFAQYQSISRKLWL